MLGTIDVKGLTNNSIDTVIELIALCHKKGRRLANQLERPSWENLYLPLEELENTLTKAFNPLQHLNNVVPNQFFSTRDFEGLASKMSEFTISLQQHPLLYKKLKQLQNDPNFKSAPQYQQVALKNRLNQAEILGANLSIRDAEQLKSLKKELTTLGLAFKKNIADSTSTWQKHILENSLLEGLPEHVMAKAKQQAKEKGLKGWLLGLDVIDYIETCESRALREILFKADRSIASEIGPGGRQFDNGPIMERILQSRAQIARLLDLPHYGAYSTRQKMMSFNEVEHFLSKLQAGFKTQAEKLNADMHRFAFEQCGIHILQPWDYSFVTRKMAESKFNLDMFEIDSHYTLDQVMQGTFNIIKQLYGYQIVPKQINTAWHKDVVQLDVLDKTGQKVGSILADFFARDQKRPGAWTWNWQHRFEDGKDEVELPIACLTTNFTKPVKGKKAQLSFEEATTFVHELGHTLHMTLNKALIPSLCPLNGVPWDAIEVPSTFMEDWLLDPIASNQLSVHPETHQPLSPSQLNKMSIANDFSEFSSWLCVLAGAITDYKIHTPAEALTLEQMRKIQKECYETLIPVSRLEKDRSLNQFTHLFAVEYNDGYALGYYSYLLSKAMATQVHQTFKNNGGLTTENGQSFLKTMIEPGGSQDFYELFKAFIGDELDLTPFLVQMKCHTLAAPKLITTQYKQNITSEGDKASNSKNISHKNKRSSQYDLR